MTMFSECGYGEWLDDYQRTTPPSLELVAAVEALDNVLFSMATSVARRQQERPRASDPERARYDGRTAMAGHDLARLVQARWHVAGVADDLARIEMPNAGGVESEDES